MDITLSPSLGVKKLNRSFGQLNLTSKSQFLRDRLRLLRQAGKAPPETLHQIESRLNAITQEPNPVGQWNSFELAYEGYIPIAPDDDLLSVLLDLRARADLLDSGNQEVWSKAKLDQMEQDLRLGHAGSTLRIEIASLARAIHECGLRRRRDTEIRMCIVRRTLYFTALLCVGLISALLWMEVHNVPAGSAWHLMVTAAFGAIGALVGAALQLRRRHLITNDVQADQASVLFRGAFGAVLAVVVALCLQLRIVDFPFLHIDAAPNSPLAPAALYVFGFLSGLAEEPFFRRFSKKRARAPERPPLYEAQPHVDHRLPA